MAITVSEGGAMSTRKLSVVTLLLAVVAAVALMITAMEGERTGSSSLTEVRLMDWGGEAAGTLGVASSR